MRQNKMLAALPAMVAVSLLLSGFVGAPLYATEDRSSQAEASRYALLPPDWLQSFLSWLDRILVDDRPESINARSRSGGAGNSGELELPGAPGSEVTPQEGAHIDPDG